MDTTTENSPVESIDKSTNTDHTPLPEFTTETTDGSTATTDGSTATTDGSTETTDGSTEPTDGSTEPTDGSTEPTDGSTNPTDGSTETTDGSTEPTDGSTETTDGSTETTDDGSTNPIDIIENNYKKIDKENGIFGLNKLIQPPENPQETFTQHQETYYQQPQKTRIPNNNSSTVVIPTRLAIKINTHLPDRSNGIYFVPFYTSENSLNDNWKLTPLFNPLVKLDKKKIDNIDKQYRTSYFFEPFKFNKELLEAEELESQTYMQGFKNLIIPPPKNIDDNEKLKLLRESVKKGQIDFNILTMLDYLFPLNGYFYDGGKQYRILDMQWTKGDWEIIATSTKNIFDINNTSQPFNKYDITTFNPIIKTINKETQSQKKKLDEIIKIINNMPNDVKYGYTYEASNNMSNDVKYGYPYDASNNAAPNVHQIGGDNNEEKKYDSLFKNAFLSAFGTGKKPSVTIPFDSIDVCYYIEIDLELIDGKKLTPEQLEYAKCNNKWNKIRKSYADFTGQNYIVKQYNLGPTDPKYEKPKSWLSMFNNLIKPQNNPDSNTTKPTKHDSNNKNTKKGGGRIQHPYTHKHKHKRRMHHNHTVKLSSIPEHTLQFKRNGKTKKRDIINQFGKILQAYK